MKVLKLLIIVIFVIISQLFSAEFTQVTAEFSGIYHEYDNLKPCITDLDGDGLKDLLLGDVDNNSIAHWEQESSGSTTFVLRTSSFCNISLFLKGVMR